MRLFPILIVGFLVLVSSFAEPIQAQDSAVCPSFVQTALESLGDNCADSLPGSACYGNSEIAVSFVNSVDSTPFVNPGDQLNLLLTNDLHTSAIDLKNKKWGVALLKTQANLPKALNSKGVVMVALGDVRIQNNVLPENIFKLGDTPLSATVGANGADLFNVPPDFKEVSTSFAHIPAGTAFQADGISQDGSWIRVFVPHDLPYFKSVNAWVKRSELSNTANLKHLPTIGPNSFTLMQSFSLDTGFEQAACNTDPRSMLYLQGPEETEAQLTINGADIRFGSTILVRILAPGNLMQMIVLNGIGVLNHGAADEYVVTPAFASQICLSEPSAKGVRTIGKNCRWSAPSLLSSGTLEALYRALDHKIPQKLQYYPTFVPQLVCPSGIGQVRCHILLLYEVFIRHLTHLCQIGVLPKRICDLYTWHNF